jgi:hypothetical protein
MMLLLLLMILSTTQHQKNAPDGDAADSVILSTTLTQRGDSMMVQSRIWGFRLRLCFFTPLERERNEDNERFRHARSAC